ncbi:MAG: putative toxin-antitoxin system toxin component, PIN family [Acidobacteriota bacterium]
MRPRPAIIDTNVVVAGLITSDPGAPTARILDGMIQGRFPFLLSTELLAEYRRVLLRERMRELHGLTAAEIDRILAAIAANAIVREAIEVGFPAPDPNDQHLWDLLASVPQGILVTGETELIRRAPQGASVILPRTFLESLES